MGATSIEWTDVTWNPVTGCSKISEGCRNCYAEKVSNRFKFTNKPWTASNAQYNVQCHEDRLMHPRNWKKPRKVFVNSMSDLFHEQVPFEFIDKVFAVMALTPQHTYQILTKRPERMLHYFESVTPAEMIESWSEAAEELVSEEAHCFVHNRLHGHLPNAKPGWPISNVWIGTSVENQKAAIDRIPYLLLTPAAVKFLSCEPLLGPVNFRDIPSPQDGQPFEPLVPLEQEWSGINWVIAGGESGPNARPMHPEWVKGLRDQCIEAKVPFFFKQWGEWAPVHELRCNEPGIKGKQWYNFDPDASVCRVGKKTAGRILDGRVWDEMPIIEKGACLNANS